jgi:hypothetical protein
VICCKQERFVYNNSSCIGGVEQLASLYVRQQQGVSLSDVYFADLEHLAGRTAGGPCAVATLTTVTPCACTGCCSKRYGHLGE